MLCRLAWGSVARARRDYLIYLLTLTLGVTVFYAFNTISLQVDLANVGIEGLDEVLGELLGNLTVFLGHGLSHGLRQQLHHEASQ